MLKNKLFCFIIVSILLLSSITAFAADEIPQPTLQPEAPKYDEEHPEKLTEDQLYATSAILIEASTGNVIFEKNADQIMYPASTTKIMTVMLGVMMGDMDQTVTASSTALAIPDDASNMDLREGEEIRFEDLLYGTMLKSANEGANLIAETISGSIPDFVDLMNSFAQMLGCTSTHFANPDGYQDPNHYTCARDMAIIAREAMNNETFRKIVSTTSYVLPKSNIQRSRTLKTTAKILMPGTDESPNKYYYKDAIGIKTGSTSQAGYCFVGCANRDGVELISVVFFTSSSGRWSDTKKLMEYGFSQYISVTPDGLYNENPITIETTGYSLEDTDMGRVELICKPADKNVNITVTKAEAEKMANGLSDIMLFEYTRDFAAPVMAGEIMGTMTYFPENGDPVVFNLTAARSVERRANVPKTIQQIIDETNADPNPFPPLTVEVVVILAAPLVIVGLAVAIVVLLIRTRKNKRKKLPKSRNNQIV